MKLRIKKKRKYNIRLIRQRRSYTMRELSDLLGVHVRTVQTWHKLGMKPIEPDGRPLLFIGADVKRFLSKRQNARKCPLKENEFYCPRCRAAQTSFPEGLNVEDTGRRMGKEDTQVLIRGICRTCSCRLTRFSTKRQAKTMSWLRNISRGEARL